MTSPRLDVRPDMLTWAIARAGKVMDEFLTANPNVAKWIAGEKQPTLKQLEGFAKKVYVPFGLLLLEQPPVENDPLPLFRTVTPRVPSTLPLAVRDSIQQTRERQEWLSEYLQQEGETPLPFVKSFDAENNDPLALADKMRRDLDLPVDWTQRIASGSTALRRLRLVAERLGIIVVFNGVVGNSNKRKLPVDVCRGYVLIDDYAPFVFVNNSDAKTAQLFTLTHELAHLWIGQEGVVDLTYTLHAGDPVEQLCNRAAAEFLVPSALFSAAWQQQGGRIPILARQFKVSQIVIARRALDMRLWTRDQFIGFYRQRTAGIRQAKDEGGGGDFYATAKVRLNPQFLRYVDSATRSGKLLYSEAYRLTGLRRSTYDQVIQSLDA